MIGRINTFWKKRRGYNSLPIGFHGDEYLLNFIDFLIKQKICSFIETGTNIASTLRYFASKYPEIDCYSCEPDEKAYGGAYKNIKGLNNVKLFNCLSQEFLKIIEKEYDHLYKEKTLFWLDAHDYGFDWPLKEEIEFIFQNFDTGYILVDDFKVPHLDVFGFDSYGSQECSYEYIKTAIPDIPHQLFYPNYKEKTSKHHPLRGWGLLVFGEELNLSEYIQSFTYQAI